MPVFAADLLPDTTGRNLGSPSQRWNANIQSLDVAGSVNFQIAPGLGVNPSGVIFAATNVQVAQANVVTEQLLWSCTVPAGLLNVAGKVLRCTLGGAYLTQAGQTPQMTIAIRLGSLTIFNVAANPFTASQPHNVWQGGLAMTVIVPGTAAQVDCFGQLTIQNASTGSNASPYVNLIPGTGYVNPVDLTIAEVLQVVVLFSTNTSPANVCTHRQFIVEVLN